MVLIQKGSISAMGSAFRVILSFGQIFLRHVFPVAIFLFTILFSNYGHAAWDRQKVPPKIINGVLDLKSWNFNEDGPVPLTGEWQFYWKAHIHPRSETQVAETYIPAPKSWNSYLHEGEKIGGQGFATYRLKILLNEAKGACALKILDMATAFRLYINGRLVASAGMPGQSAEKTQPGYLPGIAVFDHQSDLLDIIVHVSNFNHWQGGLKKPVMIGSIQDLQALRERRLILDYFLFGSIVIMGLYHLSLHRSREDKKRTYQYFGIFCLMIAIRILVEGERYLTVIIPGVGYETLLKAAYLPFYISVPVFAMYLNSLFPEEFSKKVVRALQVVGALFAITTLVMPARYSTPGMPIFQIITLAATIYAAWTILLACLRKRDGAAIFLAGFLSLAVAVTNDILYTRQWIITGHFVPLGLFVFIFSQAFLLSRQFSKAFSTVQTQRQALENEIVRHVRTARALQKSEALYRQYFEEIQSGAFIADPDGHILECNQEFISIFGFPAMDDALQTRLDTLYHDPEQKNKIVSKIIRNKSVKNLETTMQKMDGTLISVLANAVYVPAEEDNPGSIRGYVLDITELKQLESELNQAKKMEAIGTLVGGIAHDFNNILQAISGYVELLSMTVKEDDKNFPNFKRLKGAVGRAGTLIREMMLFSRKAEAKRRPLNLNREIKQAHSMLEKTIPKMISFTLNLDKNLWYVNADPIQMEQMILNFGSNAADAMPEGGAITIETGNIHLDATNIYNRITNQIKEKISVRSGDYVMLTFSDTGCGIEPSILKKIFLPFFSTKDIGKGTGLGLSSVYGIVKKHKGYITCTSKPGDGTTFLIYLPACEQQVQPQVQKELPTALEGTETILMVDDENELRKLASRVFIKFGYQFLQAASGEEALEMYSAKKQKIDLIILDVSMPGIGGRQCLTRLMEIDPDTRVIMSSGYAEKDQIKKCREQGAAGYISKPYQFVELIRYTRQILDR